MKRLIRSEETEVDVLILDDTTLDRPYVENNLLMYHWSGKHKKIVRASTSSPSCSLMAWQDAHTIRLALQRTDR